MPNYLHMRRKFCTFAADFIKTLNIMKPSYFILALLCAFSMAFVSCENNDPDTKKGGDDTTSQHQPANPATWSPVGKMYIVDISGADKNPYGYSYFMHVVHFFSKDSALQYCTTNHDLSPQPDKPYYTPSRYQVSYPDVIFIIGVDRGQGFFTDTLTFSTSWVHRLKQD